MIIKESEIRKTVREHINAYKVGLSPITESGIIRMLSHGKDGYFCISANRSVINGPDVPKECSLEKEYMDFLHSNNINDSNETRIKWLANRNKVADDELRKAIEAKGYSYSKTYGGYKEKGSTYEDYEPSYVVYNHFRDGSVGDAEEMRKFALWLAKKFKQQDVFIKIPNKNEEYQNQNGEVTAYGDGKPKINRDNEQYFTTSKRKNNDSQRFTSNMTWMEGRYYAKVGSLVERQKREYFGEVIID